MPVLGTRAGGLALGLDGGRLLVLSTTALSTPPATGGATGGGATAPAALGPLDITTRLMVGEGRAGVSIHYVESFGPGEVLPSRYIYGTLPDGTIVFVQMSALAYWPDGSVKTAKLAFTIPGARATGERVNLRLRTAPGAQDTTPCLTLDQLKARANFLIRCYGHDFGAEVFELRANDLITANVGGWTAAQSGTNYPTARVEVLGSGPEMMDWMFEGYVRRVGDGAVHKTYKVRLYVTYFKGVDGFQVLPEWEQPNAYDGLPDSVATAGPAKPQRIAGIVETFNGTTRIHACGGPNDWRAATVDASAFDTVTNTLTYPAGARMGFTWSNGVSWGFAPQDAATLPSGISDREVYHPGYYTASGKGQGPLWRYRGTTATSAAQPATLAWSAGGLKNNAGQDTNNYTAGSYVRSNNILYFCRTAGTPGTSGPTGTGTGITVPGGTSTWEHAATVFGTPGSGTINMYPLAHSYTGSGGTGWTREMRRVWVGSGAQPWAQIGLDFAHAMRVTRLLPKMDYEAAASAPVPTGTPMDFELHMVSSVNIWNIEATGDSYTEDRIGPLVWSHARMLLQWDNAVAWRRGLCFAGSMGDFQTRYCDERSGQMIITTRGPNNNGVTYPGHAPVNSGIHITTKASNSGNPADAYGTPAFAKSFPRFSGTFYRDDPGYAYQYNDMGGGAHMPNVWQVPYILTGDAAWLNYGEKNLNVNVCQTGWRGTTLSPNQNTALGQFAPAIVGQPRGVAWTLREVTNFEMLAPDSHPAKQFVRDIITQNCKFYRANAENGFARHLGLPTWSATTTYDVGGRPYHHGMLYYIMSLMNWRYQGTTWGDDLDVVLGCYDKFFIDMYNESVYPGAMYFHCEYGVSGTNGNSTGSFDVRDTQNKLGKGANLIVSSWDEAWFVNYGVPRATAPTPVAQGGAPDRTNTKIVFYQRTSLAGIDGSLPVQYQISTGASGMRGIRQPRIRPLIDMVNARVGNTKVPVVIGSDLVAQWSCLPLDI